METTVLGLGGAPLGNLFSTIPEEIARATIVAAAEGGIGYFDTAPQYGHGVSEHRFGHVLREMPRESYVLSTKVGRLLRPWRGDRPEPSAFCKTQSFSVHHDYSYDATMRSMEDSYQRLGLARIDIALIHDVDRRHQGHNYDRCFDQAVNGAVRALTELKAAGIIGAIGLGVNEVAPCMEFACAVPLDAYMLAGRYTLLEQDGVESLLDMAASQGFSLIVAGPFNSGILAAGSGAATTYNYVPANDAIRVRVAAFERVCAAHTVSLAAVALQFPLLQPAVCTVVTGAVRPEEITQNAALMAAQVPAALWRALVVEGLLDARWLNGADA